VNTLDDQRPEMPPRVRDRAELRYFGLVPGIVGLMVGTDGVVAAAQARLEILEAVVAALDRREEVRAALSQRRQRRV
jgi:hypothetical protein